MTMTEEHKVYATVIALLASLRVAFEHVKANKTAYKAARTVAVILLGAAALWAYTGAVSRYAGNKAVSEYCAEMERQREAEEAAAAEAARTDPYLLQLKAEATMLAKALEGVKGYHYDDNNKRTILQCVLNRVLNQNYPATVEEVLTEAGQFEFYNPDAPVLEGNYRLCYEYLDAFHKQDLLPCSYELVFIELGDKVVLRDTLGKGYDTNTWWYGK